MATKRRRRIRDDSNKPASYFLRRELRKSGPGRAVLAVVDSAKKIKRAVRKLKGRTR